MCKKKQVCVMTHCTQAAWEQCRGYRKQTETVEGFGFCYEHCSCTAKETQEGLREERWIPSLRAVEPADALRHGVELLHSISREFSSHKVVTTVEELVAGMRELMVRLERQRNTIQTMQENEKGWQREVVELTNKVCNLQEELDSARDVKTLREEEREELGRLRQRFHHMRYDLLNAVDKVFHS